MKVRVGDYIRDPDDFEDNIDPPSISKVVDIRILDDNTELYYLANGCIFHETDLTIDNVLLESEV